MGNFGSASADKNVPPPSSDAPQSSPHNHHSLVQRSIDALYGAATAQQEPLFYPIKQPSFVRHYVIACRAFGGATGLSDDRDSNALRGTDWFRAECEQVAPTIQRTFQRKGQRRFTHHGIYFVVLMHHEEQKQFSAHMKALELIQFLRLPDVVVPEAAMTQFMGLSIGCLRLLHLHDPVVPTTIPSGSPSPGSPPLPSVLAWSTRHAAVARLVIGKVLRLRNDVPMVLYESGDGRLMVVDAVSLLPELCLPQSAAGLLSLPMRAELLIGRDLGAFMCTSGVISGRAVMPILRMHAGGAGNVSPSSPPSLDAPEDDSGRPSTVQQQGLAAPTESYLGLVIASASSSKRRATTPTLHALHALQVPGSTDLGDQLAVAGTAVCLKHVLTYESHRPAASADNAVVTTHLLSVVLPSLLEVVDSLPEDMDPGEFVQLLHLAGANIHTLGVLYALLQPRPMNDAKSRVAAEMVARAAKHWLFRRLLQSPAQFETHILTLFRGIAEETFYVEQLVPIMRTLFHGPAEGYTTPATTPSADHGGASTGVAGVVVAIPRCGEAPFRIVYERTQTLTGVRLVQGQVKSVRPTVRLARRNFTLSSSDEVSVCHVAARRTDGIAGAALFAAASWWAKNPSRLYKVIDQLHRRVAATAHQPPTDGSTITHLFFTELQFSLCRLVLFRMHRAPADEDPAAVSESDAEQRKHFEYVHNAITEFIPSMVQLYHDCPHDRLHVARELMPLLDYLLRNANTVAVGTQALRHILQSGGLLTDPMHYHPVASRGMADALYKLSVEACIVTRQNDEALVVAQRWAKLCPLLFGVRSKQNCRATKQLLTALVLGRSQKAEQVRVAKLQLELCEAVFGQRDVKTAAALSECGSLIWKAKPSIGLQYFRRSLDLYRDLVGPSCRPVCSALYNSGLALARLNKFTAALTHLTMAKSMATQLNELATSRMCEVSENTVYGVAALKIQRWYREQRYGQAQSQTTKTEVTTKCSTLSWSDERDEIASSVHD